MMKRSSSERVAFGIGKVARIASADQMVRMFLYDDRSRLRYVLTVDEIGQEWPIAYEYNVNGLLRAITYPRSGAVPFRSEYDYAQNGEIRHNRRRFDECAINALAADRKEHRRSECRRALWHH